MPWEQITTSPVGVDIYNEANEILQQEYETTLKLIREGKEAVKALADKLLEKYQLTGPEIDEILDSFTKPVEMK